MAKRVPESSDDTSRITVRRWDSAANNQYNPARWMNASGQSINTDLYCDLSALMARCAHEYSNNPIFEGVVNTFKDDVVGSNGPTLQVISEDDEFNSEVERQWRAIFSKPSPARPNTGGVESAKQWVHLLLTAGSFINIFTEPRRRDGEVQFGWRTIHPRRLITPLEFVGDPNVAFGIRIDRNGDPTEYYIDSPKGGSNVLSGLGVEYDTLQPDMIQHRYIEVEPGQLTGYPMMASTLNTAADIRELDGAEIKAQQRAAAMSLGLQAQYPEAVVDPEPIDGHSLPVGNDEINVAPLGWSWQQLDANRPSPEHIAYRRERIAEYGRPFGMPLLVILLSVEGANFSSAQFSGMLYSDAVKSMQGFIERQTLNQLVEMVILELIISGKVKRPERYELAWTHNVPPNANLEKFVKALRTLVEDGTISRSQATSWLGYDPEKVAASRKRDNEVADENEISRPPINLGSGMSASVVADTEQDMELQDATDNAN